MTTLKSSLGVFAERVSGDGASFKGTQKFGADKPSAEPAGFYFKYSPLPGSRNTKAC